ncbi:ORF1194 [White spot syndrome virus]|uniref:ORF1194 n=1 Tax=White spot syndrome virus TaxID=342409 RepID=A0A2D3I6N3_9VIRU|nr:ORF1194 [White spot syndrome virus]
MPLSHGALGHTCTQGRVVKIVSLELHGFNFSHHNVGGEAGLLAKAHQCLHNLRTNTSSRGRSLGAFGR